MKDNILYNLNSDIMQKNKLNKYKKPILKVHGNLKDITLAGQDGEGDYAHKYGES